MVKLRIRADCGMWPIMAKYLRRSCPRCNGYVGIALGEPGRNTRLQAVNGALSGVQLSLAWIVIRGRRSPVSVVARRKSFRTPCKFWRLRK
jgi:hypothetical protein